MKKIFYLFALILFFLVQGFLLPGFLYADDEEEIEEIDDIPEWVEEEEKEPKPPFHIKDRKVEIGFMNIQAGFANNYLSTSEIFREKLVLNIDDLKKGLKINLGVDLSPLYVTYNKDNIWGLGFHIGITATGIVNLAGEMLSFSEAEDIKSDVGGAAFVEVGLSGFFHVGKFKIKVRPSLFYPIVYVDPDVSYTYKNTKDGTVVDLAYKMRVYTAFPLEDSFSITAYPGFDFVAGVEYPLSEVLSLKEKHPMLDFDVGVDLINIPTVPAFINDYMEMSGRMGSAEAIDFSDFLSGGMDNFSMVSEDTVYDKERKTVLRPFKFVPWIEWRPFEEIPISFTLPLGFMLSPYYNQIFSLEAGMKARYDLKNMLIATLGIGYYDRMWKNSLDLIFNVRFFELDLGAELRSQSFVKSWSGGGFALRFGMKFGW